MRRSRNQLRLKLHHDKREFGRAAHQLQREALELRKMRKGIRKEIQQIIDEVRKGAPPMISRQLELLGLYVQQCYGKIGFPSEDAAEKTMALTHREEDCKDCKSGKRMGYYSCRFCGKYHAGHTWPSFSGDCRDVETHLLMVSLDG
jgi:hypothetical protein